MPQGQLGPLLHHIRQLAGAEKVEQLTDGELLAQFVRDGDESAFAALVKRQGSMVFGVCRRVLGHAQDAEDAFQATFLVLARRAAAIGRHESVGSWLYRVAYRLAMKAKVNAAKRAARESRVDLPVTTPPDGSLVWSELRPVLDEELEHLP